ncbi:MAG TPA: hypothetical protein VHA34_09780 [Actinomycetes bacterium]|nr:hypothetical protein [Actinomycetes bacterium]
MTDAVPEADAQEQRQPLLEGDNIEQRLALLLGVGLRHGVGHGRPPRNEQRL